ncbi:ABC transporter substrate-binding protein [Breznakiella homolactica]|uniref:Extracellular solute-binding protein n=1 Tax=Breznakiella homolactica TaxID=2798577 RepID=A0A7T7XJC9_9SPIR|nr:extracellular solute-binding protein [Breznakiella homolactica]QQO07494.1 extracellular solute-binding protein [Breznakiella homolactica]
MKKTVSLLLVFVFLTAAVWNVAAGGGSEKGSGQKVVLEFPTWQAEEGGFAVFWKEMIEQFESSHPNVTVEISQIPFNQFTDTLITRFSAGDAPEIVHIASRFFDQFASQGWFASLDADFAKTDILQNWTALQKTMMYNGENQGLLVMGYGFVMYYNEKILSEAGVKVPTNRNELIAAIRAVEALQGDYNAYGITTQQHSNVYQDFSNFVVGNGGTLIKDGKYNFSDPKVLQAAEDYRFVSNYAPKGNSTEMVRQLFIDGKIAMLIDGPFVAPLLDSADPALKPFLKMARPPFQVVPGTISNSLHISSDLKGEKRDLVFEFIKQVAEPANQIRYSELTLSPAGRSAIAKDITDPALKISNGLAAEAVSILPDSANLMINYTKYTNTVINSMLKLQTSPASVTTQSILSELESNLIKEKLEP